MNRCVLILQFALPVMAVGQGLDQQAQIQSNNFWNQKFTRCGDTTYVAFKSGNISAFKNAQFKVESQPVSETDRLNGWEWRGTTAITGTSSRDWLPNMGGWQPWIPRGGFGTAIEKHQGGPWRIVSEYPNGPELGPTIKPFNCSDVPPEAFDPNWVPPGSNKPLRAADLLGSWVREGVVLFTFKPNGILEVKVISTGRGMQGTYSLSSPRVIEVALEAHDQFEVLSYDGQLITYRVKGADGFVNHLRRQ